MSFANLFGSSASARRQNLGATASSPPSSQTAFHPKKRRTDPSTWTTVTGALSNIGSFGSNLIGLFSQSGTNSASSSSSATLTSSVASSTRSSRAQSPFSAAVPKRITRRSVATSPPSLSSAASSVLSSRAQSPFSDSAAAPRKITRRSVATSPPPLSSTASSVLSSRAQSPLSDSGAATSRRSRNRRLTDAISPSISSSARSSVAPSISSPRTRTRPANSPTTSRVLRSALSPPPLSSTASSVLSSRAQSPFSGSGAATTRKSRNRRSTVATSPSLSSSARSSVAPSISSPRTRTRLANSPTTSRVLRSAVSPPPSSLPRSSVPRLITSFARLATSPTPSRILRSSSITSTASSSSSQSTVVHTSIPSTSRTKSSTRAILNPPTTRNLRSRVVSPSAPSTSSQAAALHMPSTSTAITSSSTGTAISPAAPRMLRSTVTQPTSSSVPSTSSAPPSSVPTSSSTTGNGRTRNRPAPAAPPIVYKITSDPLKRRENSEMAIVECADMSKFPVNIDRTKFKIVEKYNFELPDVCAAAREGAELGSWTWPDSFKNPGISTKKFSEVQYEQLVETKVNWTIQSVFSEPNYPAEVICRYEGIAEVLHQKRLDVGAAAREAFDISVQRDQFLQAIAATGSDDMKISAEDHRTLVRGNEYLFQEGDEPFWIREEVAYCHTVIQRQYGLGPIFYLALDTKTKIMPPVFSYSPVNIMKATTLERLRLLVENKPIKELRKMKYMKTMPGSTPDDEKVNVRGGNLCEKRSQCVCHQVYNRLYKNINCCYLKPDVDGILNLDGVTLSDRRIVVECSDACGCSSRCPRRRLQQGQQKPLVTSYEKAKGWGVRAGDNFRKGELICEYTGRLYFEPEEDNGDDEEEADDILPDVKNTSYEATFDVMSGRIIICAAEIGNIARFLNHCCDPNALFVESHSRKNESDPLIPRIAVYAFKDISIGEPITLSYFGNVEDIVILEKSGINCNCKTSNCLKDMPRRWEIKKD